MYTGYYKNSTVFYPLG